MLTVKYHPATPPLLSTPDAQKMAQYLYAELVRISAAFEMADPRPHCVLKYNGATTTVVISRGASAVTRVAAGVYDVTLDKPLATAGDIYGSVMVDSAGGNQLVAEIALANSTATNIRVHLHKATSGVLTDGTFLLSVYG